MLETLSFLDIPKSEFERLADLVFRLPFGKAGGFQILRCRGIEVK